MKIKAIVRPWGSSLGIILPSEAVKAEGLQPKEEVIIEVIKKPNLKKVFGTLTFKKSTQKIKDELRSGWSPEH